MGCAGTRAAPYVNARQYRLENASNTILSACDLPEHGVDLEDGLTLEVSLIAHGNEYIMETQCPRCCKPGVSWELELKGLTCHEKRRRRSNDRRRQWSGAIPSSQKTTEAFCVFSDFCQFLFHDIVGFAQFGSTMSKEDRAALDSGKFENDAILDIRLRTMVNFRRITVEHASFYVSATFPTSTFCYPNVL
jgi:hypothetical protein